MEQTQETTKPVNSELTSGKQQPSDFITLFGNLIIDSCTNFRNLCSSISSKIFVSMRNYKQKTKTDDYFPQTSTTVHNGIKDAQKSLEATRKKLEAAKQAAQEAQNRPLRKLISHVNQSYNTTGIEILDVKIDRDIENRNSRYLAQVYFNDKIQNRSNLVASFNFVDQDHLIRVLSDFPTQARKKMDSIV